MTVRFYGIVDDSLDQAVELFLAREAAERMVRNWNRDDPNEPGRLRIRGRRSRRLAELGLIALVCCASRT